ERSKILIKGIDEERTRIARDLHDDLGPALSLIKNYLSLLKSPKNEETIKDIQTKVDTAMNLTRNISKRIFPTILEKVGLERSLADLLEQTQTISNIICSFEFNPEFEKLSLEQKTHLFRISSECINNTLKHAQATALKIELTKNDKNYLFIYRDNGIGINEKMSHGVGLSSINQRANILGGSLKITNGEARGSIITIKFKSDNKL
ncbi:MAG: sensor histidine kinase, partial [Bacteroidia bacterium]|nr:sensor histidine kinase [Bacteroidia bacterium]